MTKEIDDFDVYRDLPNLMGVMTRMADAIVEIYKKNLQNSGRRATGNLLNNIRPKIILNDLDIEIWLNLEGYAKFVEQGSLKHFRQNPNGAFDSITYKSTGSLKENIRKWIDAKPVIPRPMANGKLPTKEQLTFLIARKVRTEGIEGSEDLLRTMEEIRSNYIPLLNEALGKDIENIKTVVYDHIGDCINFIG